MSDRPPQNFPNLSFSHFQEDIRQSSAQCSQSPGSNTSVNTFDYLRNNLSVNSFSSIDFMNSGPLRVINTNVVASSDISASASNHPESSKESSREALASSEVNTTDTSSTNEPVPNSQDITYENPSIIVTDTTRSVAHPFRRWMRTIRRNDTNAKGSLVVRQERWSLDDFDEIDCAKPHEKNINGHRKSSSWSSNGFVEVVRSATASLISLSLPPQSRKPRRKTFIRNGYRSSNRSSWLASPGNRGSMDSSQGSAQVIDDAALERALKRRRTLEELIGSEESYVSDLKVYFTLIASASGGSLQMSSQTQCNITEILNLHEEILYQIRHVIPDSNIRSDDEVPSHSKSPKHIRINSLGSLEPINPSAYADRRSLEATLFEQPKRAVLLSDPREVTEVAKLFGRLMERFFIYEEYGAKYESMMLEMSSTSKAIPNWHIYERGIEALANSLASTNSQAIYGKKGLAFEDLLIKPIQRICRYPLIFADLYKYTPVIDGPDSRVELEKVLYRLKEMVTEINRATNDQNMRAKVQRSWHLQDLLIFPETLPAPMSLRFLGHATLCGVLFVAYQCGSDVRGEYMLSVLFKSYLLLATPKHGTTKFVTAAIISLKDTQVDKPDNGRGLQCYTAPYSWKLIFGSSQQLYELLFCACSVREEEQWKSSLLECSTKECQTQPEDHSTLLAPFSTLKLDIRPLGYGFGPPGTLIRRLSIQRAATVSSRSNVCQVIITNTNVLKDHFNKETSATYSISRSQSLPMGNRVLILAPKRADRIRMEGLLTDVWTRDLLPYPGMSPNRGEHLIRTSANSMMRKLSRASKSNSLKKRSESHTTLDSGQNTPHHIGSESSIVEGSHESPIAYFRSYRRHLSGIYDESAQSLPRMGSPPRKTLAKGFGGSKGKAGENRQRSDSKVKLEGEETLVTSLSKAAKVKRSNPKMLLKAFSSDAIRSWLP